MIIFTVLSSSAQNCDFFIKGVVVDKHSGLPLENVQIYITENSRSIISNKNGEFEIDRLCEQDYHLVFTHISCEAYTYYQKISKNITNLKILLEHQHEDLGEVFINTNSKIKSIENTTSIIEQKINDNASKNLSSILESIAGVSTIKNGNSIGKPVVHGLFGNRVTILNNGIPQSGQQWGNDHAPEIDPLVANKIKVIKGVSSLEYDGTHLGSVILIEPKKIDPNEPHLHGKGSYFFETNGLSNGTNFQIQQANFINWKFNATYKKAGDLRAPNYFLTNTGKEEINASLQLEKQISDKLSTNLYLSTFNTELGILAGSRVGNLRNLLELFEREIPSNTEDNFSFKINPPRQEANHHLIKLNNLYKLNKQHKFEVTFAIQQNLRKEFGRRRANRSIRPVLSIDKKTFYTEGKYNATLGEHLDLTTGIQYTKTENVNAPVSETGVIPLIPDYNAIRTNSFLTLKHHWGKWNLEYGGRYNQIDQKAVGITRGANSRFIRFENNFNNYSFSAGTKYQAKENLAFTINSGYTTRNPEINELYSNGLHQAVAGFEIGNPNLNIEKSWKTTFGVQGAILNNFSFETLVYHQNINDYIFLKPDRPILTNRGPFLQFKYNQTDATIVGFDFSSSYWFTQTLRGTFKTSLIKADDTLKNEPLINIPTNTFTLGLNYEFEKTLNIGKTKLENTTINIENTYTGKSRTTAEQDVPFFELESPEVLFFPIDPPEAYNIINIGFTTNIPIKKTRLRLVAKVENLLNTSYRNYLNRLRYFSDDTGINFSFGATLSY